MAQTTVQYAWAQASQITGDDLPFWVDLRLEPATIAYALLLALVAAALIGLLPALKATGASIQRGLQGITSTGGTMKFGGIWSFIVGAQVACTLLFVPAAVGIYTTSVQNQPAWTAFPSEHYLTFRLKMDTEARAGEQGVLDDEQIGAHRARAYEALAGRLREEPGVTHVTTAIACRRCPRTGWRSKSSRTVLLRLACRATTKADSRWRLSVRAITRRSAPGSWLAAPCRPLTLGTERGRCGPRCGERGVRARGGQESRGRARAHAPARQRARAGTLARDRRRGQRSGGCSGRLEWSGVHVYRAGSTAELDPVVVAVRVAGDAASLAPRAAALARQIDAVLQLRDIATLEESVARQRALGGGILGVAVAGILLGSLVFSAAGLYALMAVAVQRRTREIGIRVALGANPRRVLRTVFARAGRQLGGGIIAGNSLILLIAWRADSLTASLLASSVITSVIMAAVGVLACAGPARRALRIQPTEALRQG